MRAEDAGPLDVVRAFPGNVGLVISFAVRLLGRIGAAFDGQKQCLRDKLANTRGGRRG